MQARKSFYSWTACFVFVFAAHVGTANAASDRMVITGSGGVVLFDNSMPETGTAGTETSLTFTGGPSNTLPPPVPPLSVIGAGGVSVIVLTEPASEPPDPTEPPTGPSGPITVSDVLVSNAGATAPQFISLLSDGDPQLVGLTSLPAGAVLLPETGLLQDVTSLISPLPTTFGPITVQVQSDVVPEPGTLLLLGSGLAGLAAVGARRRRV
jgi:PEP-CTERM motif